VYQQNFLVMAFYTAGNFSRPTKATKATVEMLRHNRILIKIMKMVSSAAAES